LPVEKENISVLKETFLCVLFEKKHILGAEMSAILVGIFGKKPPSRN
jgi:hypothetical protein